MKKSSKFYEKVKSIEKAIIQYCDEKGFSYQCNGENSIFINLNEKIDTLKSEIKEYIQALINISKKKLKRIITILTIHNRIYVLFKADLKCY